MHGYFDGGTGFNSTLPVQNLTNELPTLFNAVNAGTEMALVVNDIVNELFSSGFRVQYACKEFTSILSKNQYVRQSMSRKGNCWDNAVAESFFKPRIVIRLSITW